MMLTRLLLPMIVCFSPVLACVINADEQQDAAELSRVLAEIQKVVPPGWKADFELVNPTVPSIHGNHPALVIKSEAPLPLEFVNLPGLRGGGPDDPPDISQVAVKIRFIVTPYLTAEEHAAARRSNEALVQKRIQFERDHLKGIPWSSKYSEPVPPSAYEPETEKQTQLVRQYAFLWASTEPRPLPSHHTDHLAFSMRYIPLDIVKIHDDKKAKEYEQILGALEKIFVPYETDDQ